MGRETPSPAYDAVVVGSGPNGLAAAITLARRGLSVVVIEAKERIGGGMRSAELTLPGFVHDVCSAVHPLALASRFFRSLPLAEHGLDFIQPPAPLAHPLADGRVAMLERSVDATAEELGSDAAAYKRCTAPFVAHAGLLLDELLKPPNIPRHPVILARFALHALRSARAMAERQYKGVAAKALLAGNAAHSVLPLEAKATAAIGLMLIIMGHALGWPICRGGSSRIGEAMEKYFRSLGGEVFCGTAVRSLVELPRARVYLFDVAPPHLAQIARDVLPSRFCQRLQQHHYGPGVFKIDWALSHPIPWKNPQCSRAATVHVGGTLEEIAASERAAWGSKVCEHPFVLVAQSSLFDRSRAPSGSHTGWAYCHVPHGCDVDMTTRIESQIERFAPGFRDTILARHTMSPSVIEGRNANLIGGDITGGVLDARALLKRYIGSGTSYATANPSVYLCSASTPPGAGVHGMCGFNAARAALRNRFR